MNHDNIVSQMFNTSMSREGKTVSLFTDPSLKFNAFFRRNNDGTAERNTLVMYYYSDAPVTAGSLIKYGNSVLLAINQETVENEIYMKSGMMQCNGNLTTNDYKVVNLPFYADVNISSATASETGNYLSVIDGKMEALTTECALSRKLAINDTLNEWGRTWKISNLFYIDGICHIVLEVTENETPVPITYRIDFSGITQNENFNSTAVLVATACANDEPNTDATFIFSSSDENVATIDQEGNISFIGTGTVTFTATWTQVNYSWNTDPVTVTRIPADDTYSIYVDQITELENGMDETLSYYGIMGGKHTDDMYIYFTVENLSATSNEELLTSKIKVTDNGNGTITIEADDYRLIHKTFDLVAYGNVGGKIVCENRQTVTVVSAW